MISPFGLNLLSGDVLLIKQQPVLLHSFRRGAYWQVRMIRREQTFALMISRESKAELGACTMAAQAFALSVAVDRNEAREFRMPVTFTCLKSTMRLVI